MIIIGLVGPFGSGCSYVANIIEEFKSYKYLSLSNVLRELYKSENPDNSPSRAELQDYGNSIREENSSILAEKIWDIIKKDTTVNYIVDSIRNPAEVKYLRSMHSEFYLFGVFAEPSTRWNRVKNIYKDNHGDFEKDDIKDSGKQEVKYGQHVTDTFHMADIIILNNIDLIKGNSKYKEFRDKVLEKIEIIDKTIPFRPTAEETYMTMAYASSLRSSCLKRKVGAVIVDSYGNVFSSGYNEVPSTQLSCLEEYNDCYRDKLKKDFRGEIAKNISVSDEQDKMYDIFKDKFKILDYCRALHAEENAILNVARAGTSNVLANSTLYTTTYPCNLCANKIAQVGIPNIVYFEPYPMEEAKKILEKNSVKQRPFKGVTYNGYFRLMEEIL